MILAGAIISIALNPLIFKLVEPLQKWIRSHSALARKLERSADPLAELPVAMDQEKLTGQVVLVGYGRVGRKISECLLERGIHFVVAEENRELVERLRRQGIPAVAGNAAESHVLIQAHVARASVLIIATPDTFHVRAIIETARALNPSISCLIRTHNEQEAQLLQKENAGKIFLGEHELAMSMAEHIFEILEKEKAEQAMTDEKG